MFCVGITLRERERETGREERQNRVPEGAVYCCGQPDPVTGLEGGGSEKSGQRSSEACRAHLRVPRAEDQESRGIYAPTLVHYQLRPRALTPRSILPSQLQSKTKPQIELQVTAEENCPSSQNESQGGKGRAPKITATALQTKVKASDYI